MNKPNDILGLVKLIEQLSTKHYAIASFRHDAEINFDDYAYDYPLVFLEAEKQIIGNRSSATSTYSVAIQVCDIPLDVDHYTQTEAKLQYITTDIIHALTKLNVRISDTNSLNYNEKSNDVVVAYRTEFTLELGNSNTGYGDPFKPDIIT